MIKLFEEFINENVFTKDDIDVVGEQIKTALLEVVPVVFIKKGVLGGDSIFVEIVFEPKSEWAHAIWRNANHVSLLVEMDGTIEQIRSSLYEKGFRNDSEHRLKIKFRKAKAKDVNDLIKKLVDHAKKIMNEYK